MMSQFGQSSTSRCSTKSAFIISSREAHLVVSNWNVSCKQSMVNNNTIGDEVRNDAACYLMHVTIRPVYSDAQVPQSCYKKLPRLINGIPLGAGKLTKSQSENIQWRFIEGIWQQYVCVPSVPTRVHTGPMLRVPPIAPAPCLVGNTPKF